MSRDSRARRATLGYQIVWLSRDSGINRCSKVYLVKLMYLINRGEIIMQDELSKFNQMF